MNRPSQLLHPQRQPVEPLKAATVLLVRDCADGQGFEVLMTQRSPKASFAPTAYVFPGGGIEAQDAESQAHACARVRATQEPLRITQALAGLRETFEELGILLAYDTAGHQVTPQALAGLDRKAPLIPQCQARGWLLAVDQLRYLAHWTADRDLPRRFDVPFFIARMPEGQEPEADGTEQFTPVWVRPLQALERHRAGDFPIIFPTIRTLDRLSRYADTQALFAALPAEEPLWRSCPRSGWLAGSDTRYMEDEPPYGELEMVCPDGQQKHHLDWQSETAVPLRRNIARLTAPNGGVMTGPGTNSYLIGGADTGYAAIDPGPADAAHIQRLFDAAGGDIRHILCTHSHPDHSPGAPLLQALVESSGRPRPLIRGLASAPTARPSDHFVPDRALSDMEHIALSGKGLDGEIVTHTLQAVFTPGHAANHVCFVLLEDGLLFSGDHILNGSTTIINPPDGNMHAYLESLDRLDALCQQHGIQHILPAHGHVLGCARQTIAQLKGHRLAREARVLAAMEQLPDGSVHDWVALAYADTPRALWPLAERSLLAHVERIQAVRSGR
ncbi:MBL fold metallo-hydrolase [Comamonas composti]|uniref:MBL fold metallo-hydrolase n=1 Tax=Comamonas composti TaxID=408558 RepID=UPI0004125B20|nr:MBL fold metallo-hydrolase [Comamonas composti]